MQHHHASATPNQTPFTGRLGWLRSAIGALLGIGLTALVSRFALGSDPALPWLIAPMGATTVLLFVLPASPLAQPWPVIGGHTAAAAVAMAIHALGLDPALAIALAVGLAIAAMSVLRCLHAPAGGTAVLMVLGSPAIAEASWRFLVTPIALNAVLLVGFAFAYHRLTGHSYPHRTGQVAALPPGAYEAEDLDAVLEHWDEVIDVSREDLDALFRAVELQAARRRAD